MKCPACDAPGLLIRVDHFDCSYCGSLIPHNLTLCPTCRNPNPPETENCASCGEPLTLFSQVIVRHAEPGGSPYRLRQAREQAAQIQAREALSSQQRMQDLEDIDRRRIQHATDAEAARRREEKRLMRLLGTVVVLFVLVILILSVRSMFS